MNPNTEKNRKYDQKQMARVRPATPVYDCTELNRVMYLWIAGKVNKKDEIYSPYLGAL